MLKTTPKVTTRRTQLSHLESLEARQMLAARIVGSSTVYQTIQQAVNAAAAGAVINVDAGTYRELVTINKSLTLRGAKAGIDARSRAITNETIVTGISGVYGISRSFQISASNVTLDGFTVMGETAKDTTNGAGIVMAAGISGTRILNNIVKNNVAGVFVANNSDANPAVFQYNLFRDNNNAGPNGGRAIYTDGGISGGMLRGVVIDNNTFINNRGSSGTTSLESAVAFETKAAGKQFNIRITRNNFTGNGKSLLFFNTTGVVIEGNTATGVLDWYSGCFRFEGNNHDVTIRYNNITNNSGPGIAIDDNGVPGDSSNFVVNFNNITNNGTKYTKRLGIVYEQNAYIGNFEARNNWWGSTSGPSGDGPGTGDGIYGNAYKSGSWNVIKGSTRSIYSPWSTSANPVTAPTTPTPTIPGAPTGLATSVASSSRIDLTWNLGSGAATNILLERSLNGTSFSQIATLAGNATSYSDQPLAASTKYYYRVRAINSAGSSPNSNVASGTTLPASAMTYLSDMAWASATTGWGTIQKDKALSGNTMSIAGVTYTKGIGTHSPSTITYTLAGAYSTFLADVGADDSAKGPGTVRFQVLGDGQLLFDSGVMTKGDAAKAVNVSVAGVQTLTLVVTDGGDGMDYDHANWANARLLA